MPVIKTKEKKGGGYTVRTPGGVKGRHMTKENADKQERLLQAVEHNPDFKPGKTKGKEKSKPTTRTRKRGGKP